MDSPLALYRRYRPETFGQVIGQDHVTEPLRNALAHDRVNHAYLFSGPRGCGKTTSARILARTLNCVQAPVADPCGQCDSCRELATGGPGSIDVIEIDAASHGGVDDARDLRERAYFSPVRDRYKIYIIDEAHMVTNQGFNALLKLVEEPPPHLRFIFATTEPEKVIPTIRSRTHHYPFRLIPPRMLSDYVAELCQREGVQIEAAAVPLVVRAGGGSARDTLSVLDQLIGGADASGVTHQLAVALLGFTPDTLLDEVVEAFAAREGAGVFRVVDKVVESGQEPRRFAEDLLRRLRDLVIVSAVPDAPVTGLIDVSQDQGERLVAQAARFGGHELSRAADIVASGLMDMKGAIAPRLLLELICARVLLPGADHTTDGVQARLDRIEKRLAIAGGAAAAAPAPASRVPSPPAPSPVVQEPAATPTPRPAPTSTPAAAPAPPAAPQETATAPPAAPQETATAPPTAPAAPAASAWPTPARPGGMEPPVATSERADVPERGAEPSQRPAAAPAPAGRQAPSEDPARTPEAEVPSQAPGGPAGGLSLVDVRRLWPDVVEQVKSRRRLAWILLTQNAQVLGVDGQSLTLGFSNAGARESFVSGGNDEILRQAAIDAVGADWKIECVVDPGTTPPGSTAASHQVSVSATAPPPDPPDTPSPVAAAPERPEPQQPTQPQQLADSPSAGTSPAQAPLADGPAAASGPGSPEQAAADRPTTESAVPQPAAPANDPQAVAAARGAIQRTRAAGGTLSSGVDERALADAAASPDDPDADAQGLDNAELLRRTLGAEVIEEIEHR